METKRKLYPLLIRVARPLTIVHATVLNVFFARSFAELLKSTPVIVNTVNPGLCYSELARDATGIVGIVVWLMQKILARTTEQGGRQFVHAALGNAENPEALHGQYLNIQKVEEPSDYVIGEAGKARQDKLWVSSLNLLNSA
jgi:retinol dehydrogenase 12